MIVDTRKSWHDFYFGLARQVANQSRDPSTKCGSVIVRPDKTIAGIGFNGFARGVMDTAERYADRDFKIAAVVHAEENAILNASGPVVGCILYITSLQPCAHCASVIVQSGITQVYAERFGDTPERWRPNMAIAETILSEGGVSLEVFDRSRRFTKPRVVVESPFAGEVEANIAYARLALQDCLLRGEAPIASHLLHTQPGVLRDDIKGERELGMEAGWAWIDRADYVVVYQDRGLSQGMMRGIAYALDIGTPVIYRSLKGVESDAA